MKKLDTIQQSAFCEIGNIGSGHAATALAELVGRRVMLTVPKVWLANTDGVPAEINNGAEMWGTHFKVLGEPSGGILFALTQQNASKLLELLVQKPVTSNGTWSEAESALLKETGLILCASYLNALNQLMQLRLIPSIPKILSGRMESLLKEVIPSPSSVMGTGVGVGILNLLVEGSTGLEAFFFFVPEKEGLDLILERLGVLILK